MSRVVVILPRVLRTSSSKIVPQPPNKTNVIGRMLPGDAAKIAPNELDGPLEQCNLCEHIHGCHPGPMGVSLGHGVERKDPLPKPRVQKPRGQQRGGTKKVGELGIRKVTTLTMYVFIVSRESVAFETLTLCNQVTM